MEIEYISDFLRMRFRYEYFDFHEKYCMVSCPKPIEECIFKGLMETGFILRIGSDEFSSGVYALTRKGYNAIGLPHGLYKIFMMDLDWEFFYA